MKRKAEGSRTQWFSAKEQPGRPGNYHVSNPKMPTRYGKHETRYWTGSRWLITKGGTVSTFGNGIFIGAHDQWRGLAEKPEKISKAHKADMAINNMASWPQPG